eukprot:scaffold110777_cov51-Attheya_sp.AAC.3
MKKSHSFWLQRARSTGIRALGLWKETHHGQTYIDESLSKFLPHQRSEQEGISSSNIQYYYKLDRMDVVAVVQGGHDSFYKLDRNVGYGHDEKSSGFGVLIHLRSLYCVATSSTRRKNGSHLATVQIRMFFPGQTLLPLLHIIHTQFCDLLPYLAFACVSIASDQ